MIKSIRYQPLSLNEIGKRENNEDSIYPRKGDAKSKDNLFLVCDGVGGSAKGEIASKLACESFANYFTQNTIKVSNSQYLNNALVFTEESFDNYINNYPTSKGMGTTITLLHFHEAGATISHCGDSRVYQIRNGNVIYKTQDHSYLNAMIESGAMTLEEAKNHPKRNVILRAVQGSSVKKTEVDTEIVSDIKNDDYFFLCSDGILESVSDDKLSLILKKDISDKKKIDEIHDLCKNQSKDNFSAYLIKIKSVEGSVPKEYVKKDVEVIASLVEEEVEDVEESKFVSSKKESNDRSYRGSGESNNKKIVIIIFLLLFVISSILVILYFKNPSNTDEVPAEPETTEETEEEAAEVKAAEEEKRRAAMSQEERDKEDTERELKRVEEEAAAEKERNKEKKKKKQK